MNSQLLDPVPIWIIFIGFAIITLACYEIGFRAGRWWQDREPGEQEGPTDVLVGALLALMAFMLAVTMGMASDRFDTRRGTILAEASAITAVYLQSDYLPPADGEQLRELVREYVPLRIVEDKEDIPANIARSVELQQQMWALVAASAQSGHSPDLVSALGDSVTELVTLNEARVVAGLYARVPETVLWVLLAGSALSLGMVGYMAGLKRRRSVAIAVVLVVALGVVLMIVMDLDRPLDGLVNVSQQALRDVQLRVGPPAN